jgi:cytochrome c553
LNFKNIIAGISTFIVLGLMVFTYSNGKVYHGGEHGKVIEDFGDTMNNAKVTTTLKEKDDRDKEIDALTALQDKAGNIGAFKVSNAYKSKCASCHGVNGSGFQNGKAMMGPKLIGQSREKIFKSLVDFKTGRKENIIMKGLLISLDEDALKKFSIEIGEFSTRAKALVNSK